MNADGMEVERAELRVTRRPSAPGDTTIRNALLGNLDQAERPAHHGLLAFLRARPAFEPDDELRFQAWRTRTVLPHIRFALMLGLVCMALFVALDTLLLPSELAVTGAALRLALAAPVFVGTLYLTFRLGWARIQDACLTVAALSVGLCAAAIEHLQRLRGAEYFYLTSPLVIFAIYAHARQQFGHALLCGWAVLAAQFASFALLDAVPRTAVFDLSLGLVANLLGMASSWDLDASLRREFADRDTMRHLAERDCLTGVYNRRMKQLLLGRAWEAARRGNADVVMAMVDIDHFKLYNDRHGHQQGDACLARVAALLGELPRREADFCARYGGEEFFLLFYDADATFARRIAAEVLDAIKAMAIPHDWSPTAGVVTASIGMVVCKPARCESIGKAIEHADRALYAAKSAGRDRAEIRFLAAPA